MNKRLLTVTLIIIIAINVSLLVSPVGLTISLCFADVFILVSAMMMLFSYILAFKKSKDANIARSRFFGWPVMRVGVEGFAASTIINSILIVADQFFDVYLWIIIVVNIVLLSVIGIGLIGIDSSRNFIEAQRAEREIRTGTMKELRSRSRYLAETCHIIELQGKLEELEAAFRYSDPNSSSSVIDIEDSIRSEMDLLEIAASKDIKQSILHINKIQDLLKKRNSIVLSTKE